jgi:hypothetical protein
VLQDKAYFIGGLKLRVYADYLWMAYCHHLLQVEVDELDGDWVLQTLLEDLFEAVYQVGVDLLTEVSMRPLAYS